jgi:hypothetical protein
MTSLSLDALDAAAPMLLRQRRRALTPAWSLVSFAVEVLALDLAVLERQPRSDGDHLHAIIDDLPDLMAGRGDDEARVQPMDLPDLFAAADTDGLLDLHREMAGSDLDDPEVARSLLVRMDVRRRALMERQTRLEEEIDRIRETLLRHYAAGTASTDDWLH